MDHLWEKIISGFFSSLFFITFIQMILYWVDPSLPRINKLRFKKTMLAACMLFLFITTVQFLLRKTGAFMAGT